MKRIAAKKKVFTQIQQIYYNSTNQYIQHVFDYLLRLNSAQSRHQIGVFHDVIGFRLAAIIMVYTLHVSGVSGLVQCTSTVIIKRCTAQLR